jgi:hypothetical protein
MVTEKETRTPSGVDKGLVAMFLKMSPEHAFKPTTPRHELSWR